MVTGFILANGSQVRSVPPNTAIQYVAQGVLGSYGTIHFMVLNVKTAETVLNQYVSERFDQAWIDAASPYQPGDYVFFPDADNSPGVSVRFTVSATAPMPVDVGGNPLQNVQQAITGTLGSVLAPVTKVATDVTKSLQWPLIAIGIGAAILGVVYLKGVAPGRYECVPERARLRFEMLCPGCRYHYFLEVFQTYEIETCPICGKSGAMERFRAASSTSGGR